MSDASPIAGVPMVRVLDESGKEILRGWYVFHKKRQLCPFDDELCEEDVEHLVAIDSIEDWNMPRKLKLKRISSPYRIEPEPEPERTCRIADTYTAQASTHLREVGRCDQCGERIETNHKYCFNCGAKVMNSK